ncbi:MAG: hypothetical protein H6Q21_1616, partial [Bacteroidetes bacterium]|nr:hypothetical protein [Bacteroidota bacterium]
VKVFFESIPVEFIQAVLGSKPDKSFRILENAYYYALGYALLYRIMFKVDLLGRSRNS